MEVVEYNTMFGAYELVSLSIIAVSIKHPFNVITHLISFAIMVTLKEHLLYPSMTLQFIVIMYKFVANQIIDLSILVI